MLEAAERQRQAAQRDLSEVSHRCNGDGAGEGGDEGPCDGGVVGECEGGDGGRRWGGSGHAGGGGGEKEREQESEKESWSAPHTPHARAALDPNHTHFICVDDGTVSRFGVEIPLRAAIEDAICSPMSSPSDEPTSDAFERLSTPMVLLVVSGGLGTLRTVLATLEKQDRDVKCSLIRVVFS